MIRRETGLGLLAQRDRGSGTIVGAALLFGVGALLSVVGLSGHLSYCGSLAQTGADMAAIEGAKVLNGLSETGSVCDAVRAVTSLNKSQLKECVTEGSDVHVQVVTHTGVPFLPAVEVSSRAGPLECN